MLAEFEGFTSNILGLKCLNGFYWVFDVCWYEWLGLLKVFLIRGAS